MGAVSERAVEELLAKQAIREVLQDYCRSVDRLDRELMLSVWNPGCQVKYEGSYQGSAEGLVDWFMEVHLGYEAHSHQITNVTIRVDGDRATSEAYVTARIRTFPDEDGRRVDLVVAGRYLDTWSCHDGVWGIDTRYQITDLFSQYQVVGDFAVLPDRPQTDRTLSRRSREDPSYAVLASLDTSVAGT